MRWEQEVRTELSEANAADKDKIALLETQLTTIQAKLKNPESALEEYKAKLAQAYKAFDDLKREVLPEQIKHAREALAKGETANAEKLFSQVLTRGTENAAEAAFQLGQLALGRVDCLFFGSKPSSSDEKRL
jgi:seryl-tRNA synthetase